MYATFVVLNTKPRSQSKNTCSATVRLWNTLSADSKIVGKSLSLRRTWTCTSRTIPCQRYSPLVIHIFSFHSPHFEMFYISNTILHEQVICSICGKQVKQGSMPLHMILHTGKKIGTNINFKHTDLWLSINPTPLQSVPCAGNCFSTKEC